MDLDKFLANLKELDKEIDRQNRPLGEHGKNWFAGMGEIFRILEGILPEWFFFIEQTQIGAKEDILTILSDLEEAMRIQDRILLADTLLYGLQAAVQESIVIISGAMEDE